MTISTPFVTQIQALVIGFLVSSAKTWSIPKYIKPLILLLILCTAVQVTLYYKEFETTWSDNKPFQGLDGDTTFAETSNSEAKEGDK